MKKLVTLLLILLPLLLLTSLATAQGKWETRAKLPDLPLERTFHFTIGNKMYVGAGRNVNWLANRQNATAVWTYEFESDTWTRLSDFPGGGIRNARSFVIDDQAYVVTGFSNQNRPVSIFWKYDPATDTWEELPDFPGEPRTWGAAFAINGKGYLGLGGTPTFTGQVEPKFYNDFYEYDPASGEWTQLADFPGKERWRSFGFVLDDKAYVGGGDAFDFEQDDFQDTYRYDPATDTWTQVADFPTLYSFGGFSFALDGKGYANEGGRAEEYAYQHQNDLYAYDPETNQWSHASTMIGPQWGALYPYVATYEGKVYIGGGTNYSLYLTVSHDEFFVWDKDGESVFPQVADWEELGKRTVHEEQKVIYSIATVGDNVIWAAPAGLDFDRLSPLELTLSTDNGDTWQTITVDAAEIYNDAMVYAVDADHVFVFASIGIYEQSALWGSQDGGATWQELLGPNDNNIQLARGLHFFDANTGICFGLSYVAGGILTELYRTTDGGTTWALDGTISGVSDFASVENLSGNNGYDAVGDIIWLPKADLIYRSTDRGATWTAVSVIKELTYSLAFENELEGMTVSSNDFSGDTKSSAFRTRDGGLTWEAVDIPRLPLVASIEHIPGTQGGYIAYASFFQFSSDLLYTPNFGDDWYVISAPTSVITAHFTSPERGFIGTSIHPTLGADLFSWTGSFPAAPTSTRTPTITTHFKVYPNPFTDRTLLEFELKDATQPVHISVTDVLGRQLHTWRLNTPNVGLNQLPVEIDAPGGSLLFITLRQGQGYATLRVVKE